MMWLNENSPEQQNKIRFNDKCKKEKNNYDAPQIETNLNEIPKHFLKGL